MKYLIENHKLGMRRAANVVNAYKFPTINHIDEIRPALVGHEEFRERDCGDHIVITYVVNKEDSFPHIDMGGYYEWNDAAILRRECRGIAFDKLTGMVIRRPPHKFFNLNERPEAEFRNIDWRDNVVGENNRYRILQKLDGSCISAYKNRNGRIIWGTPAGETDFSPYVEKFVAKNPQYAAAASYLIDLGWTPTFEFCSHVNHVVVRHDVERLPLTCVRHVVTGAYLPYDQMVALREFGIEVVEEFTDFEYRGGTSGVNHIVELAETLEGTEGWVIRFESGHMLKVKTKWYRDLHGACTEIRFEKDVLNLILNRRLDDLKPHLVKEKYKLYADYEREIYYGFEDTAAYVTQQVRAMEHLDKKSFASRSIRDPFFHFIMYGYDQKIPVDKSKPHDPLFVFMFDYLWEYVRNRLTSQTWVDRLRYLYGNKRFEF